MLFNIQQRNGFGPSFTSCDMVILVYLPLARRGEIRLIDIRPRVFANALQLRIYYGALMRQTPRCSMLYPMYGAPKMT